MSILTNLFKRKRPVSNVADVKKQLEPSFPQIVPRKVPCPRCLHPNSIHAESDTRCSECNEKYDKLYIQKCDQNGTETVPITIVGFRQHGKTVFLSSLYLHIGKIISDPLFQGSHYRAINESALDVLKRKREELAECRLPAPTPTAFATPLALYWRKLPLHISNPLDVVFLLFDTGGENFANSAYLKENAGYLTRSKVLIWLVSIDDLDNQWHLDEFLPRYEQAIADLGRPHVKQRLIVVLTKCDNFLDESNFPPIAAKFIKGDITDLGVYQDSQMLRTLSLQIQDWLKMEHGLHNFVNQVREEFSDVIFLPSSALGSQPENNERIKSVYPRGVLLPLFCAIRLPRE
jgi:hypothetical protein